MFNFFGKNKSTKLTDEELRLKAAGVNFAIFTPNNFIKTNLHFEYKVTPLSSTSIVLSF